MKTPRQENEELRRNLKNRAAAFAMAAEDFARDPLTPPHEAQFAKRLAGNCWRIAQEWPDK